MTEASADYPQAGTHSLLEPAFIETLRSQMLRFARLQLSDSHLAEDAVQEALIGALKNAASFKGQAALKTWVFAILKNKIADTLRQQQRRRESSLLMADEEEAEDFAGLFQADGHWQPDDRPAQWGNPQATLQDQQFWTVFEACLDNLPPNQSRAFMMREFIELDSAEICRTLQISTSNLNVMLHRARLRLRECLETRWFAQGGQPC